MPFHFHREKKGYAINGGAQCVSSRNSIPLAEKIACNTEDCPQGGENYKKHMRNISSYLGQLNKGNCYSFICRVSNLLLSTLTEHCRVVFIDTWDVSQKDEEIWRDQQEHKDTHRDKASIQT